MTGAIHTEYSDAKEELYFYILLARSGAMIFAIKLVFLQIFVLRLLNLMIV